MPAGPWQSYDSVPFLIGSGDLVWDAATYKLALFLSTSNADELSNAEFADLTDEHAAANGYAAGGAALATPSATQSGRDAVFTFADKTPAFTATGGSIVFRWRVIYVVGTVGALTNPLIAVALGDAADTDITIPSSDSLNEIFDPVVGVFTLSGTV